MSISQGRSGTLLGLDQPERVEALRTSSSLFHLLGARPLYGRLLLPEDDTPGKPPVVILSHGFWKRLFNADPNVVGRSITLNGIVAGTGADKNQFTVAGVLGPDFLLNDEVMPTVASIRQMDVFLPLPLGADAVTRRGDENYNLMARLKPGVTMEQAQADVSVIAARIREKDKRDRTFTISVVPLLDQVVGNVRRAVLVLLGFGGAGAADRLRQRRQPAADARQRPPEGSGDPHGARRGLAAAGAAVADGKRAARPDGRRGRPADRQGRACMSSARSIPATSRAWTSSASTARCWRSRSAMSILTGIVFGLAPALRAARVDLNTALKAGGRSTQGDGGFGTLPAPPAQPAGRVRGGALADAADRRGTAGPQLRAPAERLSGIQRRQRDLDAARRQRPAVSEPRGRRSSSSGRSATRSPSVPGVKVRGAVTALPFTSSVGWGSINVEGFTPQPGQELQVDQRAATPDYFRTMEIPLVKGRFFTDFDAMPNAQPVAIIDEKFAQRFWPNEDPIGKHLWDDPKQPMTIVGVVGTVKQYGLDIDGRIVVYRPSLGLLSYQVARTSSDPAAVAGAIVRAIHAVDPTIPVYDVRTMQDRMSDSLARQRFSTIMLGAFAVFALILAVVGVYGVMSYLVTQGTHDIGVRMALGAQRSSIVRMVMRQGMELTGAGIVLGLIGAAALTRVMASLLFGVSATDLVTFSAVPVILAAIALLASYLPARRATRVDPVVALREE